MATYSGTPRTWSAGETLTAALMNSDVRDPLAALAGAGNSFTPTVGGTGWAQVNGTVTGRYLRIGKLVLATASFTYGTTSTYGGSASLTLSLPVTANAGLYVWALRVVLTDTGAFSYVGHGSLASTTAVTLDSLAADKGQVAITSAAYTPMSTDIFSYSIIYEAA